MNVLGRNVVTRFNPSTNGPLHVGHAYTALVNERLSVSTRGEFILRFDDNQRYWWQRIGRERMQEIAQEQLEDLMWLGIKPDRVTYQSKKEQRVTEFLADSKWQAVMDHWPCSELRPIAIVDPPFTPAGLASYVAVEKVVLDYFEGVTAVVRGLEFLSDSNLERYFCCLLGFPPSQHIYIPRLMAVDGLELTSISKTEGNWKLRDLRERGFEPADVLTELRGACMIDQDGEWDIDNLKTAPQLSKEALCFSNPMTT